MTRLFHKLSLVFLASLMLAGLSACSGDDDGETATDAPTATATPTPTSPVQSSGDTPGDPNREVVYLPIGEIVAAQQEAARNGHNALANTWTAPGAFALPGTTSGGKNVLLIAGYDADSDFLSPVSGEVKEAGIRIAEEYSILIVVIQTGDFTLGIEAQGLSDLKVAAGDSVQTGDPLFTMTGENIALEDQLSRLAQVALFDVTRDGATLPEILMKDGAQVAVAQ